MIQSTHNYTPAIAHLTSTLGSTYRVTISSGRSFVGSFVCIDPQGNLVLERTTEYEGEVGQGEGRDVGMVLVPRKWWTKVERELLPGEEADEDKAGCVPA
jgi:small nuclear ribonucleoprotein (snRNP)-like protein